MPPLPFKLPSLSTIVMALLGLLLVVQTVRIEGVAIWPLHIHGLKEQLSDTKAALVEVTDTYTTTVANYRAAASQAHIEDAANVDRVKREQAAINERTKTSYEARLADARARADRLRSHPDTAANPGSRSDAGLPGSPGSSSGTPGPAAEDGLSPDDRLIATEQAIQLDELIKWVRQNLTVDYSGNSKSSPSANH